MPVEATTSYEMSDGRASTAAQRSPLSIRLLFYLVTAGAILSACLRTVVANPKLSGQALASTIIGGLIVGLIFGASWGLFSYRSFKAACICSLTGMIVGSTAGGLAAVGADSFREIVLIAFGGCWLLIVVMLLSARFRVNA